MTVEVQAWDETSSATYEAADGATDMTFPFAVPSNATALKGEVGLRFTTNKRPSHVNDLLDTYGPVLLV
ncbi:hypothetical protein EXIGLDRAFT_719519 [Exidia glandulosa HHB12029]|uniref:Uncharacterized protein n=1 Tax=Exidia glandulosa HHB12029 TaxID=1314781 RepID=A0A165NS50_EXIGL|nr:hypothetical protein EXIGLDRAFT_719519 [Exidia glandulosa HHB12029]